MHKSTNTFWWISRIGSWPTKLWLKVKNDHRSKFSNLSNWKEEAWKKSGLQRDSNLWPPRYRCVALPTELWSHTLGARSIYWVKKELNKLKTTKGLTNNQVCTIFHMQDIQKKRFTQIIIKLCMLTSLWGAQIWLPETNRNICFWVFILQHEFIAWGTDTSKD